jgi:hypothetical protein
MLHILFMHMHVFHHLLFGKMGEFGAVGRSHLIDGAHICFAVQELAGHVHIHPFTFLVPVKPFFPEGLNGHTQVLRNSLLIPEGIRGCHGAAAIGAGKTIRFLPYFRINHIGIAVKIRGRIVFNLSKETPQPGTVLHHIVRKLSSVIGHRETRLAAEDKRILNGKYRIPIFVTTAEPGGQDLYH